MPQSTASKSDQRNRETPFHPPIEPYETGLLDVGGGHRLFWEWCGNPTGQPVVFLHGGPGSGARPEQRRYFDPDHYRLVLFDQRGAGRSQPLASVEDNTTWDLVADIERLREAAGIDRWLVFGGSWGSTLALAYAQSHPDRCTGIIVRGIWLCRDHEMAWWLKGTRTFFPENWRAFANFIPEAERDDLLGAYHRRLMNPDPAVHMPAAVALKNYESNITSLHPRAEPAHTATERTLSMSRIMIHFVAHRCFLRENQLIEDIGRMAHLPGVIVQGRYDMICPTMNADELARAWPKARYEVIPDAGHAADHPAYRAALMAAVESFKGAE